jgi:hypothetical protein
MACAQNWKQAFSQKGVQASWEPLERKMDTFGRPNSGGKGKLFSIISLSILIYLKRNSFEIASIGVPG